MYSISVFRLNESNAPGENLRFARISVSSVSVGILQPESVIAERRAKTACPGTDRIVIVFTGQVAQECESRRLDAPGAYFLTCQWVLSVSH